MEGKSLTSIWGEMGGSTLCGVLAARVLVSGGRVFFTLLLLDVLAPPLADATLTGVVPRCDDLPLRGVIGSGGGSMSCRVGVCERASRGVQPGTMVCESERLAHIERGGLEFSESEEARITVSSL